MREVCCRSLGLERERAAGLAAFQAFAFRAALREKVTFALSAFDHLTALKACGVRSACSKTGL